MSLCEAPCAFCRTKLIDGLCPKCGAWRLSLCAFLLLLSGCSVIGSGMDKLSVRFVDQVTDYCAEPLHRREALYILVNGELAPQKIEISVICPGE